METEKLCDSCYCRLCAEENKNGTYLFSQQENSQNLSKLINKYLPLKIENNNKFPNSICPGCHIQLEATKLFMDLIVQGQMKLRDLYRKQHELHQKQERQKKQLQEALQSVNPSSTVQTYTIQTDETGELQSFIQIFSDGPLFPPDHELALRAEGLERPRRKRGRPAKQVPSPNEVNDNKEKDDEQSKRVQEVIEEAETSDGRRRRKIRPPAKFAELVQGEELEKILKKEGIINEEECSESKSVNGDSVMIGTVEFGNNEHTREPVYIKSKSHIGNDNKKPSRKRKYRCNICAKEYIDLYRYELHRKTHICTYTCKENDCLYESSCKDQLLQHQKDTGHQKANTTTISEDIKEETTSEENIKNANSKFHCTECPKEFNSSQSLNIHVRTIHNGEKSFACNKCDRIFAYPNSLKIHMLTHSNNVDGGDSNQTVQFPCDLCDKVMKHPSGLAYHKATEHSNGKQFLCNKCGKSFKIGQQLKRHQMVHSIERPYECSKCNGTFKTLSNLASHQLVHTGEKKYCCSECGHKFAHRTSLVLHKRWHDGEKPFKCNICNKTFTQKGNLVEHQRIHTGEKPYCCEQCGKSFTTSSQFKLHVKRHTGEKPLECEYCNKSFLHRDTYKTHIRRHLNERPYVCRICHRSFPEAWALKRHIRIHTKEKPYKCDVCGKAFSDRSNKQKHMRSHNVNEVMKVINKQTSDVNTTKKPTTLLIVNSNEIPDKEKQQEIQVLTSNLQLTQLVDPQGNPISITTQDGQNIPIVTNGKTNIIQGLLPNGTLVPINLEKNMLMETEESPQREDVINLQIENNIDVPQETNTLPTNNENVNSTNIQLITGEDGQEMCLVTYALEENPDVINQSLDGAIFLAPA